MMEDLRNEYASKTRVVAMLLEEQKDWSSENETILEELRVVIDADQISVSNETGILIASTDFSSTGKRAYRAFYRIPQTLFSQMWSLPCRMTSR